MRNESKLGTVLFFLNQYRNYFVIIESKREKKKKTLECELYSN